MTSRIKRSRPDLDPNKSDSEDETYASKTSPTKKRKRTSSSGQAKSQKKSRRRVRDDSDSDNEDASDVEDIEECWTEEEEAENEVPTELTATGRPKRGATKKVTVYDDGPDSGDEFDNSDNPVGSRSKTRGRALVADQKEQLIIKLKVPSSSSPAAAMRSTRSRAGKSVVPGGSEPLARQRRSSRVSHDEQETLVALSGSGRHVQTVRQGSVPADIPQMHPRVGGKGLARKTSTIVEASQEDSGPTKTEDQQPMRESQGLQDPEGEGEEDEQPAAQLEVNTDVLEGAVIAESVHAENDENDEDDEPVKTLRRSLRSSRQEPFTRLSSRQKLKIGVHQDDGSDFDPGKAHSATDDGGGGESSSNDSTSQHQATQQSEASSGVRRSKRTQAKRRNRAASQESENDLDPDELAEEAADLLSRRKPRRAQQILYDNGKKLRSRRSKPDYRIYRPELAVHAEDDDAPAGDHTPLRRARAGAMSRTLFSTLGPFGGAGGPTPIFAGPEGTGAAGGANSDSSDDDIIHRPPRGIGGVLGMTPTSAAPHVLFPPIDQAQATSGGLTSLGRVKDKKVLADADPLGVDTNVTFDGVGGLDNHINQLKEMVMLPLLYPEVFQYKRITPPRGVLFHGPPGTGKTLLARALASSVSSQGRKVTFYMRKGADALSKWVGEAERQLRLLFEEARKNQPSIIFFDEIDGLAPVRSSKQEQIHASIVATLLALMDGMDGRGQVIVIGATNRPDSVDPALRRPGRFDREFYFPLPNLEARRAIIEINTRGWHPPLTPALKDELASMTKGYGGADLRALCTEAALNAIQGTYPQIYKSNEKLKIDPSKIEVLAKDFMISINRMIPSSERSAPSGANPLDQSAEPLLRAPLKEIFQLLDEILPEERKLTALEEAEYDDRGDENGLDRERMRQDFERAKIHRPRLLVHGMQGMGQQYIARAILNKFERLHVQSFDLSMLFSDAGRSPEAAVIQLFNEVRRHKPSVIYIPNINVWYRTVGESVVRLFTSLVKSLPPNDPVFVLGILGLEPGPEKINPHIIRDLFGYSYKNSFELKRPDEPARREYFEKVITLIKTPPSDFPDASNRRKRILPTLEVAPLPNAPEQPTKEELKAQKKQDRLTLNLLKIRIQPIMDEIKKKHKRFRVPIVDENLIGYLFDEQSPEMLSTDLRLGQAQEMVRPYELHKDKNEVPGILEVATGKFYYNLEITTIEKRLSNGYYKRPRDFLDDIKRLAKDAKTLGDPERTLKANEIAANVEVDLQVIIDPALTQACEEVYIRDKQRHEQQKENKQQGSADQPDVIKPASNLTQHASGATTETSGPVHLGVEIPGRAAVPLMNPGQPFPYKHSPLTNGESSGSHHRLTNGSSDPAQLEDVNMSSDQEDSDNPAAVAAPAAPSQNLRSQKSALTPLASNSQPVEYHNSASTTSSGQKTSDKSHRSSGPYVNTQGSNGVVRVVAERPDFTAAAPLSGGSQLPDTQDMLYPSSGSQAPPIEHASPQRASQASQTFPMAPPPTIRHPPNMAALLNPEPLPPLPIPHEPLQVDEAHLASFHETITHNTSGCSVEQLEQLNAAMMAMLWKHRAEWNRIKVQSAVLATYNDTIKDIERMQKIAPPSQEKEEVEREWEERERVER